MSIHIDFTNRKLTNHPTGNINESIVYYVNNAKCVGMTLDTKLW